MAFSRAALAALLVVAVSSLGSAQAAAQETAPAASEGDAGVAEAEETVARDSPRASITDFLRLCNAGDFEQAASYLDLPAALKDSGPTLARQLKAVLDRKAWIELETLSPQPTGDLEDGLPGFTDEIGRIDGGEGTREPVRIVRRKRNGVRWVFSSATVGRIDRWYRMLDDRWLLEHLPERLLRTGPRQLMWWQWLALPLLIGVAWVCALGLALGTTKALGKLALRSETTWDDVLVERMRRPLTLWWTLGVTYFALSWLELYAPARKFVHSALHTIFLVSLFWALARAIDISAQVVFRSPWASTRDASRSLISLGSRVAKVAVIAIGGVATLSQLGYPVATILAGLGVGGLAVALAAQKTLENLFGAFSIGGDQPFREGDLVRVEDFMGTVELIGLRSTKFRTFDRTLISIPNGKLAEMRLETYAVRDRLRFAINLPLARATTEQQLRMVMEGVEAALHAQPKLAVDSASVKLEKFGVSSFDVEVLAYFETRDWAEFRVIRQELLLQFMTLIARAGTALALPASTVHVQPSSAPREDDLLRLSDEAQPPRS